jgi:hypothetical protein
VVIEDRLDTANIDAVHVLSMPKATVGLDHSQHLSCIYMIPKSYARHEIKALAHDYSLSKLVGPTLRRMQRRRIVKFYGPAESDSRGHEPIIRHVRPGETFKVSR